MINPGGVHFLLTYRCLFSCDHCFVWGDPSANVVFSKRDLDEALNQLAEVPSVRTVYFEGGEPFLYYPLLLHAVRTAAALGYAVGIVTNGYWATSKEDALEYLRPFAGQVTDLTVSTDLFHSSKRLSDEARAAIEAAEELAIPIDTIICEEQAAEPTVKGDPVEVGGIMYRGRAASKLTLGRNRFGWETYNECPHERLDDPGRVHVDPYGEVHLCQGISLGNLFQQPLKTLFMNYQPTEHAISGPLLQGGPAELVRRYQVSAADGYVDACHLCYEARSQLRGQFPEVLTPGLMYGEGLE